MCTLAKENGYTVHEGPRADKHGTGWRQDAAKLEAMAQIRRENPNKSLPNMLTSIDKAHAVSAKTDGGAIDRDSQVAGAGQGKIEE